ncbi:MAG: tRNA sulfurtransferase [Candidatus Nanohaloarchaea archaeon]
MEHALVRYGEIGTKSSPVRGQMVKVLRQRVEDRLLYDGIEFETVSRDSGRVVIETGEAEKAAGAAAELPGVASASPALKTSADIEDIKEASEEFDYGETFGVETRRAGEHGFSSRDVNEEVGSHVEDLTGAAVDLDDPDTLLGIEVRLGDAYLFTERFQGPDGYPVGSQEPVAALISGGIDSPVAAYEVMTRGSDIVPVYFYNRPVAAEDHRLRFEASVKKLKRFHPGKNWEAFVVDMDAVNEELMEMGRGRMVLHRIVLFRVAEELAWKEGLEGIVTGESLGQKSSQTPVNLALTSGEVSKPVFRPLLTWSKNEIVESAKEVESFEEAKIASACSTMAPDNPATSLTEEKFAGLRQEVDIERLVDVALENAEKVNL